MGESLLVSRGGSFLKIGCNVKLEPLQWILFVEVKLIYNIILVSSVQ